MYPPMVNFYLNFEGWGYTSPSRFSLSRNLLKCLHGELNTIVAHDGIRAPLIQSYYLIQNYVLIAITETALNEYTPDKIIQLDGYTPIRKHLPIGTRHGG